MLKTHFRYKGFILLCMVQFASVLGRAEENGSLKKTLQSIDAPVIMEGRLAVDMIGEKLAGLRLYALRDGELTPIRFQIDEMTDKGDWILPEGPVSNGNLGNQIFDAQDKLVFMSDDLGDKAPLSMWPPGYLKGLEIEVNKPKTDEKAWCYFLYFSENAPPMSPLPDYVQYDYDKEVIETEYYRKDFLIKDTMHTNCGSYLSVSEKAGGNNRNFIDRLKGRTDIKILWGAHFQVNEEMLNSSVLAYKRGPVRIIRRSDQYFKMPFLPLNAIRIVADDLFYRNLFTVPLNITIPFQPNRVVTSFTLTCGIDLNPDVIPSKIITSMNPAGYIIDGKPNENKQQINPIGEGYSIITGVFGTMMTRYKATSDLLAGGVVLKTRLIDDENALSPPDTYPGSIGYYKYMMDFSKAKRGRYKFYFDFYIIPFYRPRDEKRYIEYSDIPLAIKAGALEGISQVSIFANVSDTLQGSKNPLKK